MLKRALLLICCLVCLSPGMLLGQGKMSVLWCDPLLNIRDINSRASIGDIITKAQGAGFQAIALGMKAITGEVMVFS